MLSRPLFSALRPPIFALLTLAAALSYGAENGAAHTTKRSGAAATKPKSQQAQPTSQSKAPTETSPANETGTDAETGGAVQWVVLQQDAHPLVAPAADAAVAPFALHNPQTVTGATDTESEHDAAWVRFERDGTRYYLPIALVVRRVAKPAGGGNLPIGAEAVDRWVPLPLDYRPSDLVALDRKWDYYSEKRTLLLRREAAEAAERMFREAEERDRVRLRVVSAFRSAETQRSLYLQKVAKSGTDQRLVAKPGHSEHQLGTAMDLCAAEGGKELQADFGQTPEGKWLRENAARYGFRLSFTEATAATTGYDPEPWHVRYLGGGAASAETPQSTPPEAKAGHRKDAVPGGKR